MLEFADRVAGDQPSEHIGEIRLRIDAIQFAGFDERSEDCPVLATAVGASEQRVLSIEGERADGAFDHVRVDLDPPVVEEAGQTRPAREA